MTCFLVSSQDPFPWEGTTEKTLKCIYENTTPFSHVIQAQILLSSCNPQGQCCLEFKGQSENFKCFLAEGSTNWKNPLHFRRQHQLLQGFPGGSDSKESVCSAGDPGLIPGLGRSPGEGNGNPPQDSCLENPMDRRACTAHGVTKS